jgi:hypothetical protein
MFHILLLIIISFDAMNKMVLNKSRNLLKYFVAEHSDSGALHPGSTGADAGTASIRRALPIDYLQHTAQLS